MATEYVLPGDELDVAALALWAAREEAAPEHLRRLIPDDADRLSASWIETRRQARAVLLAAEKFRRHKIANAK
jgi:hypothetical protein